MPRKRSSSSEQTPTGSELRRSQVRQAQRVYHARRKEAFHNLEERVRFLEQTVQDMSTVMISLNDALVSSPAFRRQPELVRQLENALRQTITSASTVHPSANDANAAPTPATQNVSSASAPASRTQSAARAQLRPLKDEQSTSSSLALLERRSLATANPSISNPSSISITLKHPMASYLFPFLDEWSAFALRLYWSTLTFAYTEVADRTSAVAAGIFRYTLPTRSRETILTGLRKLLDYRATTPTRPDGSIVLTQRALPAIAGRPGDYEPIETSNKAETPEQLQRRLHTWMTELQELQTNINTAIQCSLTDANQEWLRANEIESYLEARGARLLQDASVVELPLHSGSRDSSMPAMDPLEPLGSTWEELEMAIMASTADEQGQLYALADADGDSSSSFSTTTSARLPASSSAAVDFDAAGFFSTAQDGPAASTATAFDPLSWHEPRSVFLHSAPFYSDDYIPPMGQPLLDQPQVLHGQGERCTVSMDDLIQAFTAIGVCVGGGARYPTRAIDATLDALALGQGQMVY